MARILKPKSGAAKAAPAARGAKAPPATKGAKAPSVSDSGASRVGRWYVTIGSKGAALWRGAATAQGGVIPLEDCHGEQRAFPAITLPLGKPTLLGWKGNSDSAAAGKAARGWVSNAGSQVVVSPLEAALKSGLVVAIPANVGFARDGHETVTDVIVPKGTSPSESAPQYCGTTLAGRGGRIETRIVPLGGAGRLDSMRFSGTVRFTLPKKTKKTEKKTPAKA